MKIYSTHAGKLQGPIQINRIIVKAPPQAVTQLWGPSAIRPLATIEGSGQWSPGWQTGPIMVPERQFCGFQIDPPTAKVQIQTLYSPL